MTPPLCLTTYFPPIPPPYPPLTSLYPCSSTLFLIWHLPSPLAPRPFPLLSISLLSIFLYPLLLFSPLPSHLLPLFLLFFIFLSFWSCSFSLFSSTSALLHSFWYLLLLLLFTYPPPFSFSYSFLHAFSSSLSSTSSFRLFLCLSSFFYSSYSPSLLHSPSPFPHHSLFHFSSSLLIPLYPPLIRPLLIFLFFFLFSFHLFLFFLFSCLPLFHSLFLFLSLHSSPLFPPSSFLFIHFFYISFLFFLLSLALIPSPSSLRPYFILLHLASPFSNHFISHISSIFFISLYPPLIRSLLVFLFFHFFYRPILFSFPSSSLSVFACFSFISLLISFASLIDSSSFSSPFSYLSPLFLLCILSLSYVNFSSSPSFSSTFSSSCSFFFPPPLPSDPQTKSGTWKWSFGAHFSFFSLTNNRDVHRGRVRGVLNPPFELQIFKKFCGFSRANPRNPNIWGWITYASPWWWYTSTPDCSERVDILLKQPFSYMLYWP